MAQEVLIRIKSEGAEKAKSDSASIAKGLGDIGTGAASAASGADRLSAAMGRIAHYTIGLASIGAVAQMASSLSDASLAAVKLQNTLNFATGSAKAGAEALDYIGNTANRLGIDLATAGTAYAKFAASAQGTSVSANQVKAVFESVSKASMALGLSADETNGAMLALSQMMSKGTVSAEELRGQLGERIPGAFNIAARAMGVTTAELGKMLEAGTVVADDFLPKFAAEMEKTFGSAAGEAADSAIANVNRLASAWEQLKREMGTATNAAGRPQWLIDGLNEAAATMREATAAGKPLIGVLASIGGFLAGSTGGGKFSTDALKRNALSIQEEIIALEAKPRNSLSFDTETRDLARLKSLYKELQDTFSQGGKISLPGMDNLKEEARAQMDASKKALDDAGKFGASWTKLYADNTARKAAAISELDALYASETKRFIGNQEQQIKLSNEYAVKRDEIDKKFADKKTASPKSSESDRAYQSISESLAKYNAELDATMEKGNELSRVDRLAAEATLHLGEAQQKSLKPMLDKARAMEVLLASENAFAAFDKEFKEKSVKEVQAILASSDAIDRKAIEMERANYVYGLGKSAIEELTIAELENQLASEDSIDLSDDKRAAIEAEIKSRKRLAAAMKDGEVKDASAKAAKDAASEWQKTTDQINQSLTDALMRGFESGKDFASNFKDTLVNMFKTMVLKPIISFIVSPLAQGITGVLGGLGIPGMANAAGAVGGAGSALQAGSSVLNLAGGLMPTASATGASMGLIYGAGNYLAAGAGGAMATGMGGIGTGLMVTSEMGIGSGFLAGAQGLMGGAASGLSGATSLGMMLPGIGLAVGAIALLSSLFQDKGGPKTEGNAFGTLGAGGSMDFTPNTAISAPFGDGDWGRPGANAAQVEKVLAPVGKSLSDYITRLGGSATGLGLHMGYNTDPEGEAPDNVASTLLGKDGKELYRKVYDVERGKGAEAMAAEFNAMTLAAAQAVDLTPILDALLDGLGDVGKLSEEAIQQSLASLEGISKVTAGAFEKTFGEAFDVEKIKALGSTGENLIQTFGRLATEFTATNYIVEMMGQDIATAFGAIGLASAEARESLISMAGGLEALGAKTGFFFEKYYTEDERKAVAMKGYESALKDGFSTLGISIPNTTQQFRELVEAQDLSTDAGRKTYLQILDLADEFYALAEAGGSAAIGIQSIIAAASAVGQGSYGSYNVAQANSGEASWTMTGDGQFSIPDYHTATGVDLTRFQTTAPEGYTPANITNALNELGMAPPTSAGGSISRNSAINFLQGAGVLDDQGRVLKTAMRRYATGGFAEPGLAIVGEEGPELVDFGQPARVYTAEETRRAMSGNGSDDRTAAEIKSLRDEIKAALFAVAKNTRETAKLMAIWNGDGMPEVRPA